MLRSGQFALVGLGILWLSSAPLSAQESPSYVLDRISVTSGAERCSSSNFDNSLVISPVSPAGHAAACGGISLAHFGFWSVLGVADVPILLTVDRDPTDRSIVELSWTGDEVGYQVYRSGFPGSVIDPGNLFSETSACGESDPTAAASNIFFYKVVAQP